MKHETKKLIIANWKMNPATLKEAEALLGSIYRGAKKVKNVEIVLCPPAIYLPVLARLSLKTFSAGGQDCFYENPPTGGGVYTGGISPLMLKNIGCRYVIVGHSERKKYFGETDDIINKKLKAVLFVGLGAVLCVGEESRDSFDSRGRWTRELNPIIKEQIKAALNGIKKSQIGRVVVAYEPVWAISAGKTKAVDAASPDDVLSAKIFIKKTINDLYGRKIADNMRVLYGGSTDSKNAAGFIKDGQMDGLLVGASSLKASEFIKMAKSVAVE